MKSNDEIAFTQQEVDRMKSASEQRRIRLFMTAFLAVAVVFAIIGVMKIVSSYTYIRAVGIDLSAFLSLNIEPNKSYQGALCLARENAKGAILSFSISLMMMTLTVARRKQMLWMKKTIYLIEREKKASSSQSS